MNKTLTRNDLIEAISDKVGLSLNDSSDMIENIFDFILKELENGHDVKISSFGTFKVKHKSLRMGRNPKTGDKVELSGKHVPHFKPGKELRERVNAVNA